MRKLFSLCAAVLVALAVNATGTDFSTPYSCAADDGAITGDAPSNKVYLNSTADPHQIEWSDVSKTYTSVIRWEVEATRGCYVSVSLGLGTAVSSNKHIFQVKIIDAKGNERGYVEEAVAYSMDGYTDKETVKALDGTILLPAAGTYTVELRNNRDYCKGSIRNVILTYAADAPSEIVEVTDVDLNKTVLALQVEEVEQLTATVLPNDATEKTVTWTSTDEDVATVSEDGFVTAIAAGTANIKAKAGEIESICAVTVSAVSIPDVDFASDCVLSAKKAQLDGAIWKMYTSDTYKLYGEGGHNKQYGTATWKINVTHPCIVSGVLNGVEGGHWFVLDSYKGEEKIGYIAHPKAKAWSKNEIALDSVGHNTLTFAEAGEYTLILRNEQEWSSGKVASITLSFESELPKTLYLKLSSDWAGWPAKYAIYYFDDSSNGWSDFMALVDGEEDIYTATIPGEYADDKIIFVRFNSTKASTGNWDDKWSQTVNLEIPEGKDMFIITSGGTGNECDGNWVNSHPAHANGYYLVGKINGVTSWEAADERIMTVNTSAEGLEYMINVTLVDGDALKVIKSEYDNYTWFPNEGGNFEISNKYAGAKTVYVRPNYDGGTDEGWLKKCIYIAPNEATAIDNTNVEGATAKRLENGMLIIIKNGVKYNAQGAVVK